MFRMPFVPTFKVDLQQRGKFCIYICIVEQIIKGFSMKKKRFFLVAKNVHFFKRAKKKNMSDTSSHIALIPVLVLAQFFAVMPLYGITKKSAKNLNFNFFNFRILHTVIIMTGNLIMVILSTIWTTSNQITITELGKCIYTLYSVEFKPI